MKKYIIIQFSSKKDKSEKKLSTKYFLKFKEL